MTMTDELLTAATTPCLHPVTAVTEDGSCGDCGARVRCAVCDRPHCERHSVLSLE